MLRDDILGASRAGRILVDNFSYVIEYNTLAASAIQQNGQFSTNKDSDFAICYSMITAYTSAGTQVTNPDYLYTINDTGSGRSLENQSDHVGNGFGTAQRPYIWPEPKLITGGSVISVPLTNLTATAARVILTFAGYKLFYLRSYTRDTAFFLS